MKKLTLVALSALLVLSLSACKVEEVTENKEETPSVAVTVPEETPENKTEAPDIELNIKPLEETDEEELAKSAEKLGFTNTNLLHSFANALGKKPSEVTKKDIDDVHYIALGPDIEGGYSVFVGYIEYVDLCFSDAVDDPDFRERANKLLLKSKFEYDETKSLYDLANFKNLEAFEIYDVKIDDVSFIKSFNKLASGYFSNNGITDVSSLSDYNPETLIELDFTGNNISDWSPLEHIKEKVIVVYDMNSGLTVNLESYLEQKGNPAPEVTSPEATENEASLYDENGNPVDFGSLFD